jgi:hypothetical protein
MIIKLSSDQRKLEQTTIAREGMWKLEWRFSSYKCVFVCVGWAVTSAESCGRLKSMYLRFDFELNVASKHSEPSQRWFCCWTVGRSVYTCNYVVRSK